MHNERSGRLTETTTTEASWRPILQCPRCGKILQRPSTYRLLICPGCDAEYAAPNGIPRLLATTIDPIWHGIFERAMMSPSGEGQRVCYRFERQHQLMISALRRLLATLPAGAHILDVGCGHGKLSTQFTREHRVVGIDFVSVGLDAAQRRGLDVYQADAASLPFADAQFDAVLAIELFQNIPDCTTVFRELVRMCRRGGSIYISTLHRASLLRRAARTVREAQALIGFHRSEMNVHRAFQRSPEEIASLASKFPLQLRHVTWVHFPMAMTCQRRSLNYAGRPFASNFILKFERR